MSAETKTYVIKVSSEEAEELSDPKIGEYENSAESTTTIGMLKNFLRTNIKRAEQTSPLAYGAIETAKYAAGLAKQVADEYIDSWWMLEEDYVGQTNVKNAKAVIGIVTNVAQSAVAGAKAGSAAGPVGTAVGAVIGVVTSTIGIGLNARATVIDQYRSLEETAYSQYFSGVRYGLINGGRGTEN